MVRHQFPLASAQRWSSDSSLIPSWQEIWRLDRAPKEAYFLWLVAHFAIKTNLWRAQSDASLSTDCPLFSPPWTNHLSPTFLLHACNEGLRIANMFLIASNQTWSPSWDQCLLGTDRSCIPAKIRFLWSILRGVICHSIWIARCQSIFRAKMDVLDLYCFCCMGFTFSVC